jgi:hypothetical protein
MCILSHPTFGKIEENPMFKKIPAVALWALLALAVVLVPLACSSDSGSTTDGSQVDSSNVTTG